jgi:hypothetical protein
MDTARRVILASLAALLLVVAPAAAQESQPPSEPLGDCPSSPDPPIGAKFSTLNSQNQVILANQAVTPPGGIGDVNLVALDRSSRNVDFAQRGYDTKTAAGLVALANAVTKVDEDHPHDLVVISGNALVPGALQKQFADILGTIGADLTKDDKRSLQAGVGFSFIGVPGAPDSSAYKNVGRNLTPSYADVNGAQAEPLPEEADDPLAPSAPNGPADTGSLTGYLQVFTATCQYGFIFPQYLTFDTKVQGGEKWHSQMQVGPTTTDLAVPENTAGFHILIVDRASLAPKYNELYVVNNGNLKHDASEVHGMRILLEGGVTSDDLVLIQSWGQPKPTVPEWDGVARALDKLGGTESVFDQLDGTGGYALVGDLADGSGRRDAVEASNPLMHVPGQVEGVLSRGRDTAYRVTMASERNVDTRLAKVAYQPRQPFPPLTSAGQRAAVAYIEERLGLPSAQDFRSLYWKRYTLEWGDLRATLEQHTPFVPDRGFTPDELDGVRTQLSGEISDLIQVKNFITHLQEPFRDKSDAYINLKLIGDEILGDVKPPPDDQSQAQTLEIMSDMFGAASYLLPEGAAVFAGLTSEAIAISGSFTEPDGSGVLDELDAKTSELSKKLVERLNQARSGIVGIGMIIVSDYGKLSYAAKRIKQDDQWHWPADQTKVSNALTFGAKRWFYSELMPVAYRVWNLTGVDDARKFICTVYGTRDDYNYWSFSGAGAQGQYRPVFGFSSGLSPSRPYVRVMAVHDVVPGHMAGRDNGAQPPPDDLVEKLFSPARLDKPDHVGFYQEQFMAHDFQQVGPVVDNERCHPH